MKHEMIKRAAIFAAKAHKDVGQVRKYTGEPYIVHPAEVAKLVSTITDDPEIIAAAWLHDVCEDTPTTLAHIELEFGWRVARLVSDLTDVAVPSDGNRAARNEINRKHTATICPDAQSIKLCDLYSNTRSIVEHDRNFAIVYLKEKELVLQHLTQGHPTLYNMTVNSLIQSKLKLML